MPFTIQRVPNGLANVLNLAGGETPRELEDRVRPSLDLLQFYGLTQLQSAFQTTVGVVEGAGITQVLHPSAWTVLYQVAAEVLKTATATALAIQCGYNRRTTFNTVTAKGALGPFGATETGIVGVGGMLPYPLLCPPGSTVFMNLLILGTDASATCSVTAEFGVLAS